MAVFAQQVWEEADPHSSPRPGWYAAIRPHTPDHPPEGLTTVVSAPRPGSSVLSDTLRPTRIHPLHGPGASLWALHIGVHNTSNPTSSKYDLSSLPPTRPLARQPAARHLSWSPGPASQSYSQSLPQVPPPTPPPSLTPAPPAQASAPRRGGDASLPPGPPHPIRPLQRALGVLKTLRGQRFSLTISSIKEISEKCKTTPLCPLHSFILKKIQLYFIRRYLF